jgi:starch-binding outer membrane protein, SusD/RagB family
MKQVYFKNTGKYKNEFSRFQSISDQSGHKKSNVIRVKSMRSIFITIVLIPLLWSCEFLNYGELDQYTEDYIFTYIDQAKAVLTNIYSYLPNDFAPIDGAMRASASDDAEHVWDISDIQKFNDGSWNSTVTVDAQWNNMYTAIRAANVFLVNTKNSTFPEIQYNDNYKDLMKAFAVYPYEARFLRAFFYFELIKRYGSVPLDTVRLTGEEANNVSQATFTDIVKFIARECDTAIAKLPVTYATPTFISGETGRATKGAAMALKARVLLYAASPLFNPSNTQSKWVAAAAASKVLIDQLGHLGNNTYSPLPAYTAAVNNLTSKELILERREAAARTFEVNNTAVGFYGGNTGTCPSQNLVDAYEVKVNATTAVPFDWSNPAMAANPYATTGATARDPRLAMSILYNGAVWKTPNVVQTYYGGLNGPPATNTTKTGYYIKKYMIEAINIGPTSFTTSIHYWVIFRYGEVLLNYAEAMNEAYGPEAAGPAPLDNLTALAAVNRVRARTGVAMPAFPTGMSQSAFRDRLRNERRVELAFEDHRFWDIRRWKIGDQTKTIRGVNITKDAVSGLLTFTQKTVETRVWDDRMYLFPIPQTERFINPKLGQNPGW